jgi:hypothetical protein
MYLPPPRPSPLANIGKKPIRTVSLAFASLWFLLLEAQAEILLRARIFKRLWSPGIDSKELIPPAYVAWRTGTITLLLGS